MEIRSLCQFKYDEVSRATSVFLRQNRIMKNVSKIQVELLVLYLHICIFMVVKTREFSEDNVLNIANVELLQL